MKALLSIIIPMYNSERYIVRCIESLRRLKIQKEVIVVDDGSSDGSYDIARKFASNGEIKLFHQENKGVSEARNLGLDRCSGDVVVFVDSDDFIIGEGFQLMALCKNAGVRVSSLKARFWRERHPINV